MIDLLYYLYERNKLYYELHRTPVSQRNISLTKLALKLILGTFVRVLQIRDNIRREKLEKKLPSTIRYKQDLLQFVREHVQWKKKWRKIIFTNEKKSNLDGSDAFNYCYYDIRKEKLTKMRRQMEIV